MEREREKSRIRLRSGPEPLSLAAHGTCKPKRKNKKAARHPTNRGPHLAHDDWLMMRVASTRRPRGAQITQQMHISVMRSALR